MLVKLNTLPSATGTLALTSNLSGYLPLTGGTLTGALNINLSSGTAINVAGDAIFRGDTGVGTPRQLTITSGGSTPVYLDAKGYGANYITDFGIRTYNSSGVAFNVFYGTSAGDVGIGNTAPAYKLDVNGTGRFTGALTSASMFINTTDNSSGSKLQVFGSINFKGNSGYNGWIISQTGGSASAAFNLSYGAGGASNVITAEYNTGFVGIGSASPQAKLQVGAFDNPNALVIAADPSSPSSLYFGDGTGAALYRGFVEYAHENDTMTIGTSATTRMTITSGGNVGIGTSSPAALLHLEKSSFPEQRITDGTIGFQMYGSTGSGEFVQGTYSNHALVFRTNASERMRIASTGQATFTGAYINTSDVGIIVSASIPAINFRASANGRFTIASSYSNSNRTSFIVGTGTSNPSIEALQIEHSTGAATFSSSVSGTSIRSSAVGSFGFNTANNGEFQIYGTATDGMLIAGRGSTNDLVLLNKNGSDVLRVPTGTTTVSLQSLTGSGSRAVLADASGNLSAPVSDMSVKENINPIGYGLDEILKMNPVWFDFIDEYKNYGQGRQNGNIAQEMEAIIPEAVFVTQSTGKMGINYDQLHAVYIKAIQELKAEIEQLKNK